ncbi:putative quinol monooxygenase [Hoeflea algicola]|uniref:putative quinol monooxygenase n=1 Tax=Hoeflea algicola TaxID=2983763 RepID=UPI003CE542C6
MLVHTAHLRCRPDAVEQFKSRLQKHAEITLNAEEGCQKFAIHQAREEPTCFLLVEHYLDEEALEIHRVAPHYLQFRKDVSDWITSRDWWFWDPLN